MCHFIPVSKFICEYVYFVTKFTKVAFRILKNVGRFNISYGNGTAPRRDGEIESVAVNNT